MVMRGGGRSREIQRLQAAQQGGQATARQQQRLDYLQDNRGAGRRPQGPQTGGPLQQAMGQGGNYKDGILDSMRGGGQDALRTQQPWTGGASNGGTTWDGQAPMNPYGGGRTMQPGSDAGFPGGPKDNGFRGFGNQADLDAYRAQRGEMLQDSNYKDGIAEQIRQQTAGSENGYRPGGGVAPMIQRDAQGNQLPPPMQRPTPGNMPGQPPPMQRPTPGGAPAGNDPGFQKQLPPGALSRYQPGPNYFQGEGMGADRFAKFGSPPPAQQPVQGDWFRGGGMDNSRFARPGTQPAFQPPVQGNQIRGGGFGPRTQRVNKNRGSQPAGVLAQPPGKIVPY